MVHPKRLELPTFWSVARRSIQLRYECMIFNYCINAQSDSILLYYIPSHRICQALYALISILCDTFLFA